MSYRFYFYLKKTLNYAGKFPNWSKLFFQTVVMNFMIGGSGHVVRAIELKKEKINYTEFITVIMLFIFLFYL